MVDSAAFQFKVDYEQTKDLAPGKAIHSDAISTGGHTWRINWYPRALAETNKRWFLSALGSRPGTVFSSRNESASARTSTYFPEPANRRGVSMMVELMSNSGSAEAMVAVCLVKLEKSSLVAASRWSFCHVFETECDECGWFCLLEQTNLLNYVIDGQITAYCTIMVLHDSPIPVPPSDIGKHLGTLLDRSDGVDVSFIVDGETFHAHRAVLAARSPVFRAELLGLMSEATMPSITLHDIAPATFGIMLRFMYTDAFPGDNELGDSPAEMFKHLLAAADRYALDRLKVICAQKLWENVSVDTVGDALACAEIYNCPELKSKCIEFVVSDKNFKKVVLTESFMQLGLKFPSIIAEVRERAGT